MIPAPQIEAVAGALPYGLDLLCAEARNEGHRFLDRLTTEWTAGVVRFDRPGETLLAVRVKGRLVGIGGLNLDPVIPGALRIRRFYVHPASRRQNIGRLLAGTLLDRPCLTGRTVVVNAGTPQAAAFWEALGFDPDPRDGHTHARRPA